MKKISVLFLLLVLTLTGCQGLLLTVLTIAGKDKAEPKYDILSKGNKRVAVVPRSGYSNTYELQNAPREIARQVNSLLDQNVQNKNLHVVEQSKVEAWLDDCDNDFESFAEVGRDKSIKADFVIGLDIVGFQIRDPQNAHLLQGKCQVYVTAIDCATGKTVATEDLLIVYPSTQMPGGLAEETRFRPKFVVMVAEQIAALFHHHDPKIINRIDADSIDWHR